MQNFFSRLRLVLLLLVAAQALSAQQRRPIDSQHPLWLVHIDVWNSADPQKIINLIPDDIKPYVCMNLSLSCGYDTSRNIYKMPRCAVRTYKSWASVCQQNGLWFTCQPASGGKTHIQDDDLETFEYFFKKYPNFLGWNYAEQFWGFDEVGDKCSSNQESRIALFAKLVRMSHQYGGFLTISFCGNVWSHGLNPIGMMKRNPELLRACKDCPESILWLYKYTTSSCWYNNESVTYGPFISGLTKNYGVRYDNCGWNGTLDALLGENHGKKYPGAAGIGTIMEQTCMNGGAVWDGPELIWTEDFQGQSNSTVSGYTRRNWGTFSNFRGIWLDMFKKIIDGTMYIPSREEVLEKTKLVIINDVNSGNDEEKYAAWGNLYDGLYKQTDPFNRGNGQWMDNFCYFKKTGRYGAIPIVVGLYDDAAKAIPVQMKKSTRNSRWSTISKKTAEFNELYPEVSTGDLFVERYQNQLVTYTPYSYLNSKTSASANIPLQYNTCQSLDLNYSRLSSGVIREYEDHINFYLNNYRSDSTNVRKDIITVNGVKGEPTFKMTKRTLATSSTATAEYNEEAHTFTLTVNHCGPVDITIQCSGDAERDLTARPIQPLEKPKQPEEYYGPIIIEGEDMDYKSVKSVVITNAGWYAPDMHEFSGMGYVEMGTNKAGSLRHQLKVDHPGEYTVTVRYQCTSKSGNISIDMNGEKQTLNCPKTSGMEWKKAKVTTTMKEGVNDLRINNTEGMPMLIDQIIYTPAGTEEEKFLVTLREGEHGRLHADVTEAAEGETVTLTVDAEDGYQLTELRVVNSVYFTMAKTIDINESEGAITFTMPDDNVTLMPVFKDMTSVYQLDFTAPLNGSMPDGWRCVQENNEVHEYPNSYSLGARVFTGFSGYQGGALYWREGCAEYGRQSARPLTLEPGNYQLIFAMAGWKANPKYKAQIIDAETGKSIATSDTYTAAPNVNGSTSANVSSAVSRTLPFTVDKEGKYVISFTNESNSSGFDEYLLLQCSVRKVATPSAIAGIKAGAHEEGVWTVSGTRKSAISRGLNIVRTADGKTRKVLVK